MSTQLTTIEKPMQMAPMDDVKHWYNDFVALTKTILKDGLDYGKIPGVNKPSLLKPGAEKLRFVYGLTPETVCTSKTIDLEKGYVDFTYKSTIKSKSGQILAECEGNCNSYETKYRYLWVKEADLIDVMKPEYKKRVRGGKLFEFKFAVEQATTTGQYGKPIEHWEKWNDAIESGKATPTMRKSRAGKELEAYEMDEQVTEYRIPNPDIIGLQNTIMKMAQKRAFVGAMLIATGASEFFTQDVEDLGTFANIDTPVTESAAEEGEVVKPPSEPLINDFQKGRIHELSAAMGKSKIEAEQAVLEHFKVATFSEVTLRDAGNWIEALMAKQKAPKKAKRPPVVPGKQDEDVPADDIPF